MDKKKVKVWYEEHKDGISYGMMGIGLNLFVFGLGYVLGVKICEKPTTYLNLKS